MTQHRIRKTTGLVLTTLALALAGPAMSQEHAASAPASRSAAPATSASAATSDGVATTVLTPLLLLVPTMVSVDNATKNGCWARLYDQKNFKGDSFTLGGPIELAEMKGPFGFSWENKIRSLETGPKTSLTIYDNRNFRDQDRKIAKGAKVPDLSKKMGFFDDFRSLKMSCGS
jgi:hypothetical protein